MSSTPSGRVRWLFDEATERLSSAVNVSLVGGICEIAIREADVRAIAPRVKSIAEDGGFVLFDPQQRRLVVPSKAGQSWEPAESGTIVRLREAIEELGPTTESGRARALAAVVDTRFPGAVPPSPASIALPFPSPRGFVLPLEPSTRTRAARDRLLRRLSGARGETRASAALQLACWTDDETVVEALESRLSDPGAYVRSFALVGLSVFGRLSEQRALEFLREEMKRGQDAKGGLEPLSYEFLAGAIVAAGSSNRDLGEVLEGLLDAVDWGAEDGVRVASLRQVLSTVTRPTLN
jgi:hypothetical protein